MLEARLPALAAQVTDALEAPTQLDQPPSPDVVVALRRCAHRLDREGFVSRPTWTDLRNGARPLPPDFSEPGEWIQGWQFHATSATEHHFRNSRVFPSLSDPGRALLRSHSGPNAAAALYGAPSAPEYTTPPDRFRTLLLDRLQLPLELTHSRCECGAPLDAYGRHRAACNHSGRLKTRSVASEVALARVCREAGARVQTNVFLRNLNVSPPVTDSRRIEVIATGLPCYGGAQLAVDITVRSPLTACGECRPQTAAVNGVVANAARTSKEDAYPELVSSNRCRLIVLAIETGGRWSDEAIDFVGTLAAAKTRDAPTHTRASSYYHYF